MELTNTPPEAQVQELLHVNPQVTVIAQGIQILIPIEKVQQVFQEHMDKILSDTSNYSNPVKKAVDDMLNSYSSGHNKELKDAFNALVKDTMTSYMKTPGFHLQLGQAMAEEMAREAVKKLNGK